MSYEKKFPNWKEKVQEASAVTNSAASAAAFLGIKFTTYKKYAEKYGCYVKNQSGAGTTKNKPKTSLDEILNGLHPHYQTNKLRLRLLSEGVFPPECNRCKLKEWIGNPIPLELEHKDGHCSNHKLENLELLCPNCHALTTTYRGRNKGLNTS